MLQMAPFFSKFVLFFVLISTVSLSHRSSAVVTAENGKTLAMIKPDGILGNHSSVIKETINNHGFSITQERFVQLNEDTVKSFYAEHSSKSFFSSLVKYMASGPVLIMVLEKGNAVDDWRSLIGPTDPLNAKATHPHRSTISEPCVGWICKEIVSMVQTRLNLRPGKYLFSLTSHLQDMMNYKFEQLKHDVCCIMPKPTLTAH